MSLSDILDDINDGIANVETPEGKISTENVVITDVKKNGQQFSIQRLSKETLERVNTMFNLLVLKQNIANMPRVDRGIAMEVFTMLPEIGKVEQAKLTSVPSVINKEIINKVFDSIKFTTDIYDKLRDLKLLIENHIPMIETLMTYFQSFNMTVSDKVEIFKNTPPTVVEYKEFKSEENKAETKMVNLYTEKMDIIIRMDDSKFEYEKYAGKLIQMFNSVYYNETLNDLYGAVIYLPAKNELSLSDIVNFCLSIIENLNRCKEDLERYYSNLTSIQHKEIELNSKTIEFINGYEDIAVNLETIGRLKAIVETKDNCFEKVVELIKFID